MINSLKRSRAVGVSAQAGFTTAIQEVKLDSKVLLLDSPGILLAAESDPDAILRNCVNVERLEEVITPVESILRRCRKEQLLKAYQVADFANVQEFLNQIAKRRGKLRKGGVVDLTAAGRIVLQDWNNGKVPYYTLPPKEEKSQCASEIVAQWSKEFNIQNIEQSDVVILRDTNTSAVGFVSMDTEMGHDKSEGLLEELMDEEASEDMMSDDEGGNGKIEMLV